jgi:salicylate hydroxylase
MLTTTKPALQIIIAGAGLGGMAAAIALRRAGHRVTIVERTASLGVVGAGIQMGPNASRLLQAWGVVDHFVGKGVKAQAALRRRWNTGEILGEQPMGERLEQEIGAAYWCLHRADLHDALVATAQDANAFGVPVEVRLGQDVKAVLSTGPDKAVVRLANGEELAGDVVVGADGIRSNVRQSIFGHVPTRWSGRITYRHIIDVTEARHDPDLAELLSRPVQQIWLGPSGSALTHPIWDGRGIYLGTTRAGIPEEEAIWTNVMDKALLASKFVGWDPRLRKLMALADEVTGYGLHDLTPMPEWTSGRVVLLGDACHAMLPFQAQGAGQAVEDGAVLARHLTNTTGPDVPEALVAYARERQPRTLKVQQASRANADLWHLPDGNAQQQRDVGLKQGASDFESYRWLWAAGPGLAPEPQPINA